MGPAMPSHQAKKRQYDQEIESLEKQQKQTVERLEQDHTTRLRDEAKRIKGEQDKELAKFQSIMKNRRKEVGKGGLIGVPAAFMVNSLLSVCALSSLMAIGLVGDQGGGACVSRMCATGGGLVVLRLGPALR